jgi:uncharacterized protein
MIVVCPSGRPLACDQEICGVDFEWDEAKRRSIIRQRGVDILYAALILTRVDDRQDYGEERWISLGFVAGEPFTVVHTERQGMIRLITAWKEGDMTSKTIRRASLAELRAMTDRGEVRRGAPVTEDDRLPSGFWTEAERVEAPKTSVHLKLDREVFEFFKRGGKGHLTRMQNVLAAYVRAHTARQR